MTYDPHSPPEPRQPFQRVPPETWAEARLGEEDQPETEADETAPGTPDGE